MWARCVNICSGLSLTGHGAVSYAVDFSLTGHGEVRYEAD